MRKEFKIILCLVVLALGLTACSKGNKEINVDVDKLAEELQSQAVSSDALTLTAAEMLPSIYFVDSNQMTKGAAYLSSGATACEVAVIECKEASQTSEVEKLFRTRVTNQSTLFASYNAGEVDKLDDAIIRSSGKYAVLCVCDDTGKANDVLKEYGF